MATAATRTPADDDASHILIVDDDASYPRSSPALPQDKGFRITAAADAAEARRKMQGIQFRFLILDVMNARRKRRLVAHKVSQ